MSIDYFLISNELTTFKEKYEIFCSPESDHSAVSIPLHSKYFKQQREPGFWKFNTAPLGDAVYVTALKLNLPVCKEKYKDVHDSGLKWDLIKMEIRFTLQYPKRKEQKHHMEENSLTRNSMTCRQKPRKIPRQKCHTSASTSSISI